MSHTIAGPAAIALAAFVLILGRFVTSRVDMLARYSIPHAVTGGLMAALAILLLHATGIDIVFERAQQPYLMLAFFASIGLGEWIGVTVCCSRIQAIAFSMISSLR